MTSLDRELDGSLSDFDEMLRKEREALAKKPAAAGAETPDADPGEGGDTDLDGNTNSGSEGIDSDGTRPGSGTASNAPADIPDGADDDIVARQIREAAEKETDPRLREKLWEEYRKYKQGTG